MHAVKVSVVIVNYNVKDLLLACLKSLFSYEESAPSFEVIVVDNDSKDGSCEAIRSLYPSVILIKNKENAGFPKANNQGFSIAKGEYIFMLNPDTEFIENSLAHLVEHMDQNPAIQLIGPKLLNTDRSLQASVWRYPSLRSIFGEMHYMHFLLKQKNYADKNWNESFEAESFSGAAIFFRANILQKLEGLDESMFWIEDVDFCYRAVQNKMKCIYFPQTQIVHHIGQSAKKNYNISLSNQIFNKIKFFKKHHSAFSTFLVKLMSFYHVILKLLVFGLLSPMNVVYARKAKAYWYTLPKIWNPPKGIA